VKIFFSNSAIEDYYFEQVVPQIDENFVAAIVQQVEKLSDYPDIGRVVREFNDQSIRELIHSPFRIVYFRESAAIKIIRVWRSERLLQIPEH
jgi:plasmid stabilization system protein ParE